MWTEEGWRGFMRGNGTNCVRIVPYSAVQFGSYSIYKKVGQRFAVVRSCFNTYSSWNQHQAPISHRFED